MLATQLSANDDVANAVVEHVLETAHEAIPEVGDDIVPALAKLARSLGFDAEPQRAIARFRIAASSHSDYDDLWHQDSVDPAVASKNQRTSSIGFWIPLHDVGSDEGTIEFALGSHVEPIPHTDTDACRSLLWNPDERLA